jgi:hypothetical protein
MQIKTLAAAAFAASALTLAATGTYAAPALGMAGAIRSNAGQGGQVEQVTWGWHRHCYWRHGYRHCYWDRHHWRGHYRGHRHWSWHRHWRHHRWYW